MEVSVTLFFLLTLPCWLGVKATVDSELNIHQLNDRLLNIESLLQASLKKNVELETRIEVLEEDNRQLKATVELLSQDRDEEAKGEEATETEDDTHTSTKHMTRRSQLTKRSSEVPRIVMSGLPTVAFTARVASTVTSLGPGQTIVYGDVVTNVGGAYHNVSGIFIAPVNGVYVFSFMTMVLPGDKEYLEIVKNGHPIQTTLTHGTSETRYESSAMVITVEANQDDEVWIQTMKSWPHGTGEVYNHYSVFSGWLLSPWE